MTFEAFEYQLDDGLTLRGWRARNPARPVLFFLHGNGFCSRIYEPFLAPLHEHFELLLLDISGHGASDASPRFPGWNATAAQCQQLLDGCKDIIGKRKIYALGHSFGGILMALIAARRPGLFEQTVLLDPILFPRRMLMIFRVMKFLRLMDRFHPMVRLTRKRRKNWSDRQQAQAYFSSREAFRHWHELAIKNYLAFGLAGKPDGSVVLRCEPQLEAAIFASWPAGLWRSVKRIADPVTIIMGRETFSFALKAAATADSSNSLIRTTHIDGGHCFMLEQPLSTAQQVLAAFGLAGQQHAA